jgi:hypothetical protein
MKDAPLDALHALLGTPADTQVVLERLDLLDWGAALVFTVRVGERAFTLRYNDCRELRWRVYVTDPAASTPLVSFSPGRDQQRSPAQFLTAHFGLALYYGSIIVTSI